MSEKDPYAQKKKDSNDESRMDDEMIDSTDTNQDANSGMSDTSQRRPQDDINPVHPQTNMPENKRKSDQDSGRTI